ncbi:MAG: T9SS type A sorting domain-containing protein [Candidatus Zophobacter franzmannii]|nr:T9SS type A sorting domain-containing protein [Candidatus Zophobacter franzmannii]
MKDLILIVCIVTLFSTLLVSVPQYSISEATTLNCPYDYDEFIYDADQDTLVHFYSSEFENGFFNLYHFTLNSSMQFSQQTLITSVIIGDYGGYELERMFNSDSIILFILNSSGIRIVQMIANFNQALGICDMNYFEETLRYCTVANDSLVVFAYDHWEGVFLDWYTEFYKYNLSTQELVLFETRYWMFQFVFNIGDYLIIGGVDPDDMNNDNYTVFNTDLSIVSSVEADTEHVNWGAFEQDHSRLTPFESGNIISYFPGNPSSPNWIIDLIRYEDNRIDTIEIWGTRNGCFKKINENSFSIIYQQVPVTESNTYLCTFTNNGIEWDMEYSVNIPLSSNFNSYSFLQDCFIIPIIDDSNGYGFHVYDNSLNLVLEHQEDFAEGLFNPTLTTLLDKMFIIDNSQLVKYYTLSIITNNTDSVNQHVSSCPISIYPNPFNPSTTIEYNIPNSGDVDVKVYNLKGQLVKTLVSEFMHRGKHTIVWEGENVFNEKVTSGVYFLEIHYRNKRFIEKLLLVK